MCSISDCSSRREAVTHDDVKGEWLLELAANNDVRGLQAAVEEEGANVKECGRWYCRQVGSNKMGVAERSPIMIAALFGSLEVLEYILAAVQFIDGYSSGADHINTVCSADKSTVLHCAMASGASNTLQMVHLLLRHGANPSQVDSQGLCYLDLQNASSPWIYKVTGPDQSLDDDWKEYILPDSVSVTSLADVDEIWAGSVCPLSSSTSQTSSPRYSEKSSKYKSLQDDALSSDVLRSGIYTTDEFRMYSFKVRPCSRAYSHDWTECPFVHPGENARRRDPRRFHYSCVPCPDFRKGACRHGDACEYAHGVFESWLHPAQYRTRLCKDGMSCTRKVCFFAHTKDEVRPLFLSMECGGTSPGPLSPVDVASMSSPGGAASPSAALRLASFSPIVGHSSFASDKSLCDTWAQPSLPTLQLPEGAQASRLRACLSARDVNNNMQNALADVDGQLMRELASLSAHARFNYPSNNGKGSTLMSNNVEDLSSAVSPRSPLQMCWQSSPRLASKFQDTGLGRVVSTGLDQDVYAAGVGSYPRHIICSENKLSPFQQSDELGCRLQDSTPKQYYPATPGRQVQFHQRPLPDWDWDWACPTGKKPQWSVSGDDLLHFRNSASSLASWTVTPVL